MNFGASTATFAATAARSRRTLSPATIQPYTEADPAVRDGKPLSAFLSAVREEREIVGDGFVEIHLAELRVLKTAAWRPTKGIEFVNTTTGERFRCNSVTGYASDFAAEFVCQVRRLNS